MAFILTRSTTPFKLSSLPIGTWTAAAFILNLVRSWLMTRNGLEPALRAVDRQSRRRDGESPTRHSPVHLVDETDSRNVVPLHLSVDRDRLRLHIVAMISDPYSTMRLPIFSSWRLACTPLTAHNTNTAPSSTLSALSTSMVKSTCPGVSMILMA